MSTQLRPFVLLIIAAIAPAGFGALSVRSADAPEGGKKMHGLIGKMIAVEGKRDELIAILLQGTKAMPGCLSYVVAKDPTNVNAVWVCEVWEDQDSHKASLSLPAVRESLTKGQPLIAKFDQSTVTEPVGGHGLNAIRQ